jgi:hypothetical protein
MDRPQTVLIQPYTVSAVFAIGVCKALTKLLLNRTLYIVMAKRLNESHAQGDVIEDKNCSDHGN